MLQSNVQCTFNDETMLYVLWLNIRGSGEGTVQLPR